MEGDRRPPTRPARAHGVLPARAVRIRSKTDEPFCHNEASLGILGLSVYANTPMSTKPIPIGSEKPDYLAELRSEGITAVLPAGLADMRAASDYDGVDLALLDTTAMPDVTVKACIREFTRVKIPTIALVPEQSVGMFDTTLPVGDLMVTPSHPGEIVLRARRILSLLPDGSDSMVHAGDLSINHTNYEVTVAGRSVNLRFKEYELLLLMATNPGRVYTREQLLERIWGYDYLGGTRTVDVHIRRLRSKIEDRGHQFIETVWNVGYKFKDPSGW